MRGVFITFEGGDGAGKSTQVARLAQELERRGHAPLVLREPGGTAVGEGVRRILLDPSHAGMTAEAELLLFAASRAQLTREVIRPALDAGTVVLCDRYADSSVAYQGYGRGLDLERVRAVNEFATGGLVPDLTILLDVVPDEGIAAATPEAADRLEREELAFHERIRAGYVEMARREPERFVVVERADVETVWQTVRRACAPLLASIGVTLESA